MAIAVRIARAATARDKIAFCGYHGWHDWYLSANLTEGGALNDHLLPGLQPAGVPSGLHGTLFPFHYNRIDELKGIVEKQHSDLAAIVMEPLRGQKPLEGFLEEIREIASTIGAVLVFDEVTTGFRINTGGIHLTLNIAPDIAVFAKAMGNGYPMAAILGTANVMQAAQKTFISSTYWTERIGPAAALATIHKFGARNAGQHLIQIGLMVKKVWQKAAEKAGLSIHISGLDPLGHFEFEKPDFQAMKTLYTQLMLERGFLATNSFYAMLAHNAQHVQAYCDATEEAFAIIADATAKNQVKTLLKGAVSHSGFARLA